MTRENGRTVSAHTPGPWKVQEYVVDLYDREVESTAPGRLYLRGRIVADDSPMIICDMAAGTERDAHLIAAAPDLLAALEALVKVDAEDGADDEYLRVARAAIAKARGGR